MNPTGPNVLGPMHLYGLMRSHPARWLVPAVIVAFAALVYAAVRPDLWEATQALIVRNEAATNEQGPGKFSQPDEMKTVLETILELVKSRGVLAAALDKVGPPGNLPLIGGDWPTADDVDDLRDAVKLIPPKGAEFGKTEVFYLTVRDADRGRAIALATAICDQLDAHFQQLRDDKARSMVDELTNAARVARGDLDDSTRRLETMEKQVGSDLAELRILHDASSGESSLRRTATEIRTELRQVESALQSHDELLALLKIAQENPDRLVATPNELLESQPAIRRLKDGLIDAQLRTAQLLGSMSAEHPLVAAAKEAEHEIQRHLHDELESAVRGLEVQVRLARDRKAMLDDRLAAATERLDQLASLRAVYANQIAETKTRTQLLERAEQKLAEARTTRATAKAARLIARLDTPDTGADPVGPGRSLVALAGAFGGLVLGLGVLILTVPPIPPVPSAASFPAAASAAGNGTNGNGADDSREAARALSLSKALGKIARPRRRQA